MNLVGKSLVVLILVMSVVFMAFALTVYATHRNWREEVKRPQTEVGTGKDLGLQFQLENAKNQYNGLSAQKRKLDEDLAREKAFREQAVAVLETERDLYRADLDKLKTEQADWNRQLTEATKNAEAASKNVADKEEVLKKLRADLDRALDDQQAKLKDAIAATEKWQQAQAEADRLKSLNLQLTDQLSRARLVLRTNNLNEEMALATRVHTLDGVVTAANTASGLVEISLGADDGIQRGLLLEVYRNAAGRAKYMGKIEVLQTMPDKSVAKVIPEFRQGIIEKQDRVATRLNER